MHKIKIYISLVLVVLVLGFSLNLSADGALEVLQINGSTVYHYNTSDPVMTPENYVERTSEFRGAWAATVSNINISTTTDYNNFKSQFDGLLDQIDAVSGNAILFQVRPMNDAFYDSDFAPWSRYLTGTEGYDPGWDPMAYMIQASHARGIEFHAWMNPYRVANTSASKTTLLNGLAADNFAKLNPNLVVEGTNGTAFILNPGEPEVRDYITNVVDEIMDLYDIDGIHFDDYFYPYGGLPSSEDQLTYDTYKTSGQTLADFRRQSVNQTISGVKDAVDAHNLANGKDIRFGVSPGGVWQVGGTEGVPIGPASQTYSSLYADSKKWVEEGWVHYINPQIYWGFTHSIAPYADIVNWWAETVRGTGVDLLIGHGIYREGVEPDFTDEDIVAQLKFNQQYPEIKGSVLYRIGYFHTSGMQDVKNNVWTTTPLNTWATSNVATPTADVSGTLDGSLYRSNVSVTLSSTETIYYHTGDGIWTLYDTPLLFTEQGNHTVYFKATNALDEDSLIDVVSFEIEKQNLDVPVIDIQGEMIGDGYVEGSFINLSASTNPIWIAINHGSTGDWTLYTEPIELDDLGSYYIRVKTIDADGIDSLIVTKSFTVVSSIYDDPVLSIDGVGNDPYYQSATLTLTSGAPAIEYQIDGGAWTTYSSSVVLDTEGVYSFSYRNVDALQNVITKEITIDQTDPLDPVIDITGEKDGLYYIEEPTVALSTTELDVDIHYRLHNGKVWSEWLIFDEPLTLLISATYTIEYYTEDLAGNQSEEFSEFIRVDLPVSETNPFVIRDGEVVTYYNTDTAIELPTSYTEKETEVRAVWVATVSNIDIGMLYDKAEYQQEIIDMLDRLKALNFNTMFFQTRPMNDAFYDSDYAPWSRYIMGAEGIDPGWDIFEFIITEAHKRGIEVHAWLNPYRVSTDTADKQVQLDALSDENFAKQNPDLVLQDSAGKLILNPGEPQVRAYILNVVNELMSKYDVDGIHFDDYFYSYNGMDDSEDQATYLRTRLTGESLDDWRRRNVDTLIENLSIAINNWNNNQDKTVEFGISPFGIWQSGGAYGSNTSPYTLQSYSDQYADTRKWVLEGWLDYIMPQLYWEFDHSSAPFADLVDWWAELCETADVDLIIGHGFYRYADQTWDNPNEITEQLRYISQYDVIIGSSFFSYRTLNSYDAEVVQGLERILGSYWTDYVTFPWASDVYVHPDKIDSPSLTVNEESVVEESYEGEATFSLSSDETIYVFMTQSTEPVDLNTVTFDLYDVALVFDQVGTYYVYYKAVDSYGVESDVLMATIEIVPITCDDGYTFDDIEGVCVMDDELDDEGGLAQSEVIVIVVGSVLLIGMVALVIRKKVM